MSRPVVELPSREQEALLRVEQVLYQLVLMWEKELEEGTADVYKKLVLSKLKVASLKLRIVVMEKRGR